MVAPDALEPTPVAVSVITGFLGSGKTTLLNHLLGHPGMDRTAVLINEFGEIGIDHLLVRELDEGVVLLKSGCICCTVQGELVDALRDLHFRRLSGDLPAFDRVVIETTGLADPLPVVTCIMSDPLFKHVYRLETLVTTVDAVHGARQLDSHPEALRQAGLADTLVITKSDLDAEGAGHLRDRLRELNPMARVIVARFGQVDPDRLFGHGYFDLDAKSTESRDRPMGATGRDRIPGWGRDRAASDRLSRHDERVSSFCLYVDAPLDPRAFTEWYSGFAERYADHLLRVKGLLNVRGEEAPCVVQCVRSTQHEPTRLPAWPDEDRRSRIVFITLDLPREQVESHFRESLLSGGTGTEASRVSSKPAAERWLNHAEVSRLFAALVQEEDRCAADALRFMLLCGLTAREARSARWSDVDLATRTLSLAATRGQTAGRSHARQMPLGAPAIDLLIGLGVPGDACGDVFAGLSGQAGMARLRLAWAGSLARANVDELSLEAIRPAQASTLFKGLPRAVVRRLLGLHEAPRGAP